MNLNLKIIKKQVKDLIPYINNARTHDEGQVEQIAASIKEFGFNNPILLDGSNGVIAGHGRLMAAKKLGLKEVPCIELSHLSEAQKKAYILADNKIALNAGWDEELLKIELSDLDDNFKNLIGFSDDELAGLIDSIDETGDNNYTEISAEAAEEVPEKVETKCKLGDLWQLGEHRLLCGDSTDKNCVKKLMGNEKADIIVSDPPYGMSLDTDFSSMKGSSIGRKRGTQGNVYRPVLGDNDDFKPELIKTFFENFNYCKEIFLFGADYFAELLPNKNDGSWLVWDKRKENQSEAFGSEFELIWSRNKHKRRMLRHDWFGFLSSENSQEARNRVHPTQKPTTLIIDIINQWGEKACIVVDLYGGSGTTLIACERLGKKARLMELSPHYCSVIIQRWENLTGKKAVLLNEKEQE